MKKVFLIVLVIVVALCTFLIRSQAKAKEVALPVMEKCWEGENIKILSLTARPNLRDGINWRIGAKYTETNFPEVLSNPKYGYVPEILVKMTNSEIVWKHFEEISTPKAGCE